MRTVDHTGVSGTGNVAEGIRFEDGSVALRWHGDHASTVVWASLEDAVAVHGHDGATEVHWLDDEGGDPVDPVERRREAMAYAATALAGDVLGDGQRPSLNTAEVVQLAEWLMYGQASYETPRRLIAGGVDSGLAVLKAKTEARLTAAFDTKPF
jgi:hypothetical protein